MSKDFEDYKGVKEYLDSFINYERNVFFSYCRALKLERVRHLLHTLRIDYQNLRAIHIAGTKGKGSTASFCAYLLAASGYRVGLYTSPHFFDFRERIQIVRCQMSDVRSQKSEVRCQMSDVRSQKSDVRCQMISRKDVVRIVEEIKPYLERLKYDKYLGRLTFFEVYTAIAFKYFIEQSVDFVILETGLGGRLDATNVVTPLVSVITHIGYDHTDKLGKRLADIAYEKAGIIKEETAVISSSQRKAAYDEIRRKAQRLKAPLFVLGKDFNAHNIIIREEATFFDFTCNGLTLRNLKIHLKGRHQVENASLALAALVLLKDKGYIEKNDFCNGLSRTFIEGRFEIANKKPLIILDVAHNSSSFAAVADTLKVYFPSKKVILIFAASRDKDIKQMLDKINYTHLVLTSFDNPRALKPATIKERCALKEAFLAKDIREAMELALTLYRKDQLILVSGSFFLVAEAKRLLQVVR